MRIPVWPIKSLKKGQINIISNKKEIIRLNANSGVVRIDVLDLPNIRSSIKMNSRSILGPLKEIREFAEEMDNEGLTIIIENDGKTALKIGEEANSKLSRLITFSKNIEISSIKELLRMVNKLRRS